MVLGELDSNIQKNEIMPLSYMIHKNKLKMDQRPKGETENHQNPRGENRKKPLWPQQQQFLAQHVFKGKGIKSKKQKQKPIGTSSRYKAATQQRQHSTTLKATNGMGEDMYLQMAYHIKG